MQPCCSATRRATSGPISSVRSPAPPPPRPRPPRGRARARHDTPQPPAPGGGGRPRRGGEGGEGGRAGGRGGPKRGREVVGARPPAVIYGNRVVGTSFSPSWVS